jgi:hypothetical protein
VLTTVLPGLRQLRPPLSAGFLWLVAAWIALEPRVPQPELASGVVDSIYRLSGLLQGLGLGAAIAFAGYLAGALSLLLFTPGLSAPAQQRCGCDERHRAALGANDHWVKLAAIAAPVSCAVR